MTLLPVIARELRSVARQPFTYSVRCLGALALILASGFFGLQHGFGPNAGGKLFAYLHCTLFCAIWLLVPLLTADCISRERREGTLGLLFLTRLKASDLVVAIGLVHGLRALTLWLAVLPVAAIPILLGGVSWQEVTLSVLLNISALCWSLAAGLLASAWSTAWLRALLYAAILASVFLVIVGSGAAWILLNIISPGWFSQPFIVSDFAFVSGLGFILNVSGGWASYLRLASRGALLFATTKLTITSLLMLILAVIIAGARTRRVWQEKPASRLEIWWQKVFCTPVLWISLLRLWMRHKLERNPIGWLEQRTWSGRLVTWGWFAVIVSIYSAVFTDRNFFRGFNGLQIIMAWLMVGSITASAAGSFRRERQTGVLELLLVSPLTARQIITGRLRGLWGQFLPAIALLLGVWLYFASLFHNIDPAGPVWFFGVTFLTLPIVGLYFSLRCRNFIAAFLLTLALGAFAAPLFSQLAAVLWWLLAFDNDLFSKGFGSVVSATLCQLAIAWFFNKALQHRLETRSFPLERTVS